MNIFVNTPDTNYLDSVTGEWPQNWELSGTVTIVSSQNASSTLGVIESMSGSISITSETPLAILHLGREELMASSNFIVSNTISELTLGKEGFEELSGSLYWLSNFGTGFEYVLNENDDIVYNWSDVGLIYSEVGTTALTLGLGEGLSGQSNWVVDYDDTAYIIDNNGVPVMDNDGYPFILASWGTAELTLGRVEELSGTVTMRAHWSAIFQWSWWEEKLSGTIGWSVADDAEAPLWTQTEAERLESDVIWQSSISNAELTVGQIIEPLYGTVLINSEVAGDPILSTDGIQGLYGSSDWVSDLYAEPFIIPGVAENLSGTAAIKGKWWAVTIVLGDAELLTGTTSWSAYTPPPILAIDVIQLESSNTLIQSDITTASLTLGKEEDLGGATSHIVVWNAGLLDTTGTVELLTSSITFQSNIDSTLTLGTIESISGSSTWTSHIPLADWETGIGIEILSGTINIASTLGADLITLGVGESLSGTSSIQSSLYGSLDIAGVTETLSGTSTIVSYIAGGMYFGEGIEPLSGLVSMESELYGSVIDLGNFEMCSSVVNFQSAISSASLEIGSEELISGSASFNSSLISTLTLGTSNEVLEATCSIVSDIPNTYLGILNSSYGSIDIYSNIDSSILTLGGIDSLSGSINIETDLIADPPTFGEWTEMTGTSGIESIVASTLTMGKVEVYYSTSGCDWISDIDKSPHNGSGVVLHVDRHGGLGEHKETFDLLHWYAKYEQHAYIVVRGTEESFIMYSESNEVINSHLSFTELLLSEDYDDSYYRYLYRDELNRLSWPDFAMDRLNLYPETAKYLVCDGDADALDPTNPYVINFYDITANDLVMLDKLLEYRLYDAILDIDYESLGELDVLAKLIWIYLDVVINDNAEYYRSSSLLSGPTDVLRTKYEAYVIDTIARTLSDRGRKANYGP